MNWPVKKVYITQEWGVNGETYARFGYKGHNGGDLRLFDESGNKASTCLVFAPHDGVVKERNFDEDGYGNYLKIESDIEGSILAHLKEFKVNINKIVKEGDLIAIADNTGWSTGSHLHWGYYRQPRDKNNGYGGTIDPKPYINMSESCLIKNDDSGKKLFEDLVTKSSKYDGFKNAGYETPEAVKQLLQDLRNNIDGLKAERDTAREELEQRRKNHLGFVANLADEDHLSCRQDENEILSQAKKAGAVAGDLEDLRTEYSGKLKSWALTEQELTAEIARLKAILKQQNVLENSETVEIVKELIKRLANMLPKR